MQYVRLDVGHRLRDTDDARKAKSKAAGGQPDRLKTRKPTKASVPGGALVGKDVHMPRRNGPIDVPQQGTEVTQLELFAIPDAPAAAPQTLRDIERDARARWVSYTGHEPCADCLAYLHEHGGIGPNPKRGRRKRSIRATGESYVYCTPHANPREKADTELAEQAKTAAQRSASAQRGAATRAARRTGGAA